MKPSLPFAVVLVVLARLCLSAVPAPLQSAGKNDGERLKVLVDKPARQTGAMADLTAGPTAELVARTGVSQTTLHSLRRYQVLVEGEIEPYVAALIDVDYQGKTIRLGMSRTPAGVNHKAHAFDDYGKVIAELEPFLKQFCGPAGVGVTLLSKGSVADVIVRRATLLAMDKAPAAKDDKVAWVLLRHQQLMQGMGTRFEALRAVDADSGGAGGSLRGALRELSDQVAAVSDFVGQLIAVTKPKSVGQYRKFIGETEKHVEAAIVAVEADKREAAQKIIKDDLKFSCSRCHGWDGNEWKKPLEGAFGRLRTEAGLGMGVFVVGIDVQAAGLPEDRAQQLATAVKTLLLAAR